MALPRIIKIATWWILAVVLPSGFLPLSSASTVVPSGRRARAPHVSASSSSSASMVPSKRVSVEASSLVVQKPPDVGIPFESPTDHSSFIDKAMSVLTNATLVRKTTLYESILTWSYHKLKLKLQSQSRANVSTGTTDIQSHLFATADSDIQSQIIGLVLLAICVLAFWWWAKKTKFFLKYREIVPGIGKWLKKLGIDKYDRFEINIIIHEVTYSENFESFLQIEADYNSVLSSLSKRAYSRRVEGKMSATFGDAVSIVVPQGATQLKVKLLDRAQKHVLAEGGLTLDALFKSDKEELVVDMIKKKVGRDLMGDQPKAILTIYYKQSEVDDRNSSDSDQGPDLLEGLDVDVLSLGLKLEIEKLSARKSKQAGLMGYQMLTPMQLYGHQLEVIAETCSGNLSLAQHSLASFCSKPKAKWFHVFQQKNDERDTCIRRDAFFADWRLGWWTSTNVRPAQSQEHVQKVPPEHSILILYISRITPDPKRHNEFVVEYVEEDDDLETPQKLCLICGESRSRELWVECLSVLINHLRKVRHNVKRKCVKHTTKKKRVAKSPKDKDKGSSDDEQHHRTKGHAKDKDTGSSSSSKDQDKDKGSTQEERHHKPTKEHISTRDKGTESSDEESHHKTKAQHRHGSKHSDSDKGDRKKERSSSSK